jgi:hypothetical protein
VDDQTEAVWRKALQAKGKEWVMAQLRLRVGQPNDVVLDVVFQEPLPTRAFCQQWCAEEDNKFFRFSWHTVGIIAALVIVVVCCIKAIGSRNDYLRELAAENKTQVVSTAAASRSAMQQNSNGTSGNVPNPSSTASAGTASGNTGNNSPSSVCQYMTYEAGKCNNSPYSMSSGSAGVAGSYQNQSTSSSSQTQTAMSPYQSQATGSSSPTQPMSTPAPQTRH